MATRATKRRFPKKVDAEVSEELPTSIEEKKPKKGSRKTRNHPIDSHTDEVCEKIAAPLPGTEVEDVNPHAGVKHSKNPKKGYCKKTPPPPKEPDAECEANYIEIRETKPEEVKLDDTAKDVRKLRSSARTEGRLSKWKTVLSDETNVTASDVKPKQQTGKHVAVKRGRKATSDDLSGGDSTCKEQGSGETGENIVLKPTITEPDGNPKRKKRGKTTVKSAENDSDMKDKTTPESKQKPTLGERAKQDMKANKFIGAHVSIAGGLWNAVADAVSCDARAFGMFLKGQRQWNSKPLTDEDAERFKAACKEHGYSPAHILPHGSYLMNCGSPKDDIFQKSKAMLQNEMERCQKLGLTLFNFHPGSTCGEISRDESVRKIADCINNAHAHTKGVTAVLENMCRQGNTLGGDLQELRDIIDLVEDKERVGVCIDTCHAHAAGYDLKSEAGYDALMTDLEDIVGLEYLKAVHINDSKAKSGSHLDRHENIGKGTIGLAGFKRFMEDPRFNNKPFILETPYSDGVYNREIKKLYSLLD